MSIVIYGARDGPIYFIMHNIHFMGAVGDQEGCLLLFMGPVTDLLLFIKTDKHVLSGHCG